MQYYKHMMTDKTTTSDLINVEPATFYNGHNYVIEESIGYLIKQAQLALNRTVESKMSALDLTAMQWGPLMLLAHGKARTAAELSRCADVETSTMTRMLDRLEAKNLLIRTRSETDRRIIYIELTEEGLHLVAKVPSMLAESWNQHLCGFNQQEVDTLKSLLRRIPKNSGE